MGMARRNSNGELDLPTPRNVDLDLKPLTLNSPSLKGAPKQGAAPGAPLSVPASTTLRPQPIPQRLPKPPASPLTKVAKQGVAPASALSAPATTGAAPARPSMPAPGKAPARPSSPAPTRAAAPAPRGGPAAPARPTSRTPGSGPAQPIAPARPQAR
jgi:hypothetical protein